MLVYEQSGESRLTVRSKVVQTIFKSSTGHPASPPLTPYSRAYFDAANWAKT
jgi:hypothetical protein